MPSGLEILQETIGSCRAMAEALGSADGASAEGRPSIAGIGDRLTVLSSSFFFKTMPSVPATRACQRDAAALRELIGRGEWSGFPRALEKLEGSVQALAQKAGMKGTSLT